MNEELEQKISEVTKRIVIDGNIHWLHTVERAEYQYDEGRLPIGKHTVQAVISELIKEGILQSTI